MTRSSITSSKSSGKTNTANSTSFITTKSTFPRSTATTSSCYPPDREFQPRPENFSHSSSIVKPLTTSSVYASVIKPSPNPSVPACNNCLSPNTARKSPHHRRSHRHSLPRPHLSRASRTVPLMDREPSHAPLMPPHQRPRRRRSHHVLLPHKPPHPRRSISPRIHHHPPRPPND